VEYEAEFNEAEGAVFREDAIQQCLATDLAQPKGPFYICIDCAR
jgi:hypothetical protein